LQRHCRGACAIVQAGHHACRRVHGVHQVIAAIAVHIHRHGPQPDAVHAIAGVYRRRQAGTGAAYPPPACRAIHAEYRVEQVFAAIRVPVDDNRAVSLRSHDIAGDPRPEAGRLRRVRKAKRPVTANRRRRDEVVKTIAVQVRQQTRVA